MLKKELIPENLIGKRLPAFSAPDRNGNIHSDSDLRKNKKCVLIDFWASWCGPCRREIPNLKKIYEAYVDKGLEIISISIDKEDKAWQKALDEEQLPWPNLIDGKSCSESSFTGVRSRLFFWLPKTESYSMINCGDKRCPIKLPKY